MLKLSKDQLDDIKKRTGMHPVELEDRIMTLSKPLIIESACPGWQPKYWGPREMYLYEPPGYTGEGNVRFEAVPCSLETTAREQIEAVNAGAAAVHTHPRDPETCIGIPNTPLVSQMIPAAVEIYDMIFAEVDAVTMEHTWKPAGGVVPKDFVTETPRLMRDGADITSDMLEYIRLGGGNKYCQGVLITWPPGNSYPPGFAKTAQDAVRVMEENNVKPINKVRSSYHVRHMKRMLIDTGIMSKKPFVIIHDMGHPFGWPLDIDPWMPIDLISSIMQTRQRIPDSVIGVYSGGRNWLPITMTAILAGVDIVRVGIEDCYWWYPHRDDVIESNVETVKRTVDFCHMIGREVATPRQARDIMGITLTSKT
jgi:3-keto-5-aminohexanoate cleavage enzyme